MKLFRKQEDEENRSSLGILETPAIIVLVIAGSIMIAVRHYRQHQIEGRFAQADFAAIALREWNDQLDEIKVASCTLGQSPVLSVKDGDGTRQWFKVTNYTGPGARPSYVEQISATADYNKEIKAVIYAAFSGKSAAAEARQWLADNHYSHAETEWTTHFQYQQGVPYTPSVLPENGDSQIGIWASMRSLERIYVWNGSRVDDMTDNAKFISAYTSAIQKLEH